MIRKMIWSVVLAVIFLPVQGRSQKLVIDFKGQADQTESINTIRKLHFDSGSLIVSFKSGQLQSTLLDEIQKIYFGEVSSTGTLASNNLRIYPNPGASEIKINGLPEGTFDISIFQVDGKKIISRTISRSDTSIDISSLTSGIYFLSTNGFNAKFIKL